LEGRWIAKVDNENPNHFNSSSLIPRPPATARSRRLREAGEGNGSSRSYDTDIYSYRSNTQIPREKEFDLNEDAVDDKLLQVDREES
jgi:hypothetical protein